MTATAIATGSAADPTWRMHPSKVSVAWAVTRRLVPFLIEATLVPTVLFYVVLMASGLGWAFLAGLAWSLGAMGARVLGRRPVSTLLLLATFGLAVRTGIFLLSENSFVFFFQPIMRTVLTALVFALSVLVGRPLIARFARDFCPCGPDVMSRPAVVRLFRRLTYLWAGVNAAVAAVSLTLLLTVPVGVFVGTATVATWALTCAGVALTVSEAVRTAHDEGLATAIGHDGTLHAYIV